MAGKTTKNTNKKKKEAPKNTWKWVAAVAVACVVIFAMAEMISLLGPNKEYADLQAYLHLENEQEWAFVCNTTVAEQKALQIDGQLYLPLEALRTMVSSRFYFDTSLQALLVTGPNGTMQETVGGLNLKKVGEELYVHAGYIEALYPVEITQNSEARVVWLWSEYRRPISIVHSTKKDGCMRTKDSIHGEIVSHVEPEEVLYYVRTEGKFSYCIKSNGLMGYVKSSELTDMTETTRNYHGGAPLTFEQQAVPGVVCMGWHMLDIYTKDTQEESLAQLIATEPGLNVISPTWYSVKDAGGTMTDLSSADYVAQAHAAGLQVWGLVDNFTQELNNQSLLENAAVRQAMIQQLVNSAKACGMDGINMDFEVSGSALGGLNQACGPHYVQFLRELTLACHAEGLSVSVDLPVPYSYNEYFDREELGQVVDYVIIMGYDEHYNGSDPGSVASFSFVSDGVKKTLQQVPQERVILGVPFYTRQWTVGEDGSILGSRELTIRDMTALLTEKGLTPVWHDTEKENYVEYQGEHGLVRLWVEDVTSMTWKADLIRQYGLAGGAAWRLGAETAEVWNAFCSGCQ